MEKFIGKVMVYGYLFLGLTYLFLGVLPDLQLMDPSLVDQTGAISLGFMFCFGAIVFEKLYLDTIHY
ncbi:hypothetical protein [Legionella sp.]|uniref:hypothetical protein n=1 Tax=Legionella sp. TaxID=459 RepID=UPI003C925C5D